MCPFWHPPGGCDTELLLCIGHMLEYDGSFISSWFRGTSLVVLLSRQFEAWVEIIPIVEKQISVTHPPPVTSSQLSPQRFINMVFGVLSEITHFKMALPSSLVAPKQGEMSETDWKEQTSVCPSAPVCVWWLKGHCRSRL